MRRRTVTARPVADCIGETSAGPLELVGKRFELRNATASLDDLGCDSDSEDLCHLDAPIALPHGDELADVVEAEPEALGSGNEAEPAYRSLVVEAVAGW